ncbi:MAG: LCP family protein [Anaerolineales bacterium]|nr:LCP family protein [Anaerolineales bacterium]
MPKTHSRLIFFLSMILALSLACSLSGRGQNPTLENFPTPNPLFGTPDPNRTPSGPTPTATLTPTPWPTPTPVNWPKPYFGTPGPLITPVPDPAPVQHNPEDFNVVLLGSDRRDVTFATDVILVVSFQPKYNTVTLLSIPRTTVAYIPGWQMEKVNKAYQHGQESYYPGLGPALVKDTLLYNFGIEIDRYMLVDFGQFEEIINSLGRLEVPVVCPYTDYRLIAPHLDPEDADNWSLYTVPSGVVEMDGELALWYARSRLKSNDFDRNRRQQEIIRAIYSQALRFGWIKQIPTLYGQLSSSVVTDFTLFDALKLAPQIAYLDSAHIRSYYLANNVLTRWTNPYGQVMHVPNLPAVYALVAEAMGPPPVEDEQRQEVVVEVWNGTSTADLDQLAAERLNYAGYISQIGAADRADYTETRLFDFRSEDHGQAAELQALFGIQPEFFASVPDDSLPYDLLLILGDDFDPCFDPRELER